MEGKGISTAGPNASQEFFLGRRGKKKTCRVGAVMDGSVLINFQLHIRNGSCGGADSPMGNLAEPA